MGQKSYLWGKELEMKKYKIEEDSAPIVSEPNLQIYGYRTFDDGGIYKIIDAVTKGLDYRTFTQIFNRFSFTMQEWADFLHISGKTLSRYQNDQKSFDTPQSERILQINMLHSRGAEVFGDMESFSIWLHSENVALGNIVPKELLKSTFGIQLLMDELGRIEHGVLA